MKLVRKRTTPKPGGAEREGFDCLLTADQNLKYQQNLSGRKIAIFVVSDTNWKKVKQRAIEIVAAIARIQPGSSTEFIIRSKPSDSKRKISPFRI